MNLSVIQRLLIALTILISITMVTSAIIIAVQRKDNKSETSFNDLLPNKDDKPYKVIATVSASPTEPGSQAAEDDEYVLKGTDGKIHHISINTGENSLPADTIETCISINGLQNGETIEFLLRASEKHKNTKTDRYYTLCSEGRISDNEQYFIKRR